MTRLIVTSIPGLGRIPVRLRNYLDSWRFWITILGFGLILAVVLGYYALSRAIRDDVARQASSYASCVQAIPELRRLSQHVHGVNVVIGADGILVRNAQAQLDATPRTDPLHAVRAASLARLERGAGDVSAARGLPVPTVRQCFEASKHPPKLPPSVTTNGRMRR